VDYWRKVLHVEINILSPQNEPDVAVYWESCRWTGEELRDFLKVLGPTFRARGLKTEFMLPEGSSWDEAWDRLQPILNDAAVRRYINIMASHSYGGDDMVNQGRELLRAASLRFRIPVWMSEMSLIGQPDDPGMGAALRIAHYMYRDLVEANAAAWIYCFAIFNSKFPGSMGVLSPAKDGRIVIPKRYWAFANYSHFIRPGWKRIQVEGLRFANSAFISPAGDEFALVALNAHLTNERPATYQFGQWEIADVEAYSTSAERNLEQMGGLQVEKHHFSFTLPPLSVTTFVGKLRRLPVGRRLIKKPSQ
jgi:O-glycosyl hydrolase